MKRLALTLSAAMGIAATGIAIAPAAQAAGCYPATYGTQMAVSGRVTTGVVTHYSRYSLAPGDSFSESTSLAYATQLTSTVTNSGSATGGASGVIFKAEATYGIDVANSGSATTTSSVTRTFSVSNTGSTQKRGVLFHGYRKESGSWQKLACSYSTYQTYVVASGTWTSYRAETWGSINCAATYTDAIEKAARSKC